MLTPKRFLIGLLLLTALAGCNSLELAPADTWNKRLAYADSQLAGVYDGIGACVRSMACSKDTGRAALDVAHAAGNGDTVAVCFDRPQPAMACLQSAQAVISGVEAYLRAKEQK